LRWPRLLTPLAVLLLAHLVSALIIKGPVAVPDVTGYLAYAQWPAGGLAPSSQLGFFPAYGLLLAPVAIVASWFGTPVNESSGLLQTSALVLNALAAVGAAGLALWLWHGLSEPTKERPQPREPSGDKHLPQVAATEKHVGGHSGSNEIGEGTAAPCDLAASRWSGSPWWFGVVAVLVALHPSLSVASKIAWPEVLLAAFVLGLSLLMARLDRRWPAWFIAGFLAAIATGFHPRAAVLTLGVLAAVLLKPPPKRGETMAAVVGIGAAVVVVVLMLATLYQGESPFGRLWAIVTGSGTGGATASSSALVNGRSGVTWYSASGGQILALATSTFGLALVGLIAGAKETLSATRSRLSPMLRGRRDQTNLHGETGSPHQDDASNRVGIFLFVSALAALVLASLSLQGSNRADVWAYGRYLDPYAVALAIYGLYALTRQRSRLWLLVGAAGTLGVATMASVATVDAARRSPLRIMGLGNDQWWTIANRQAPTALIVLTVVAGVGLVLLVAANLLGRSRYRGLVWAVFTLGLAASVGWANLGGLRHVHSVGEVATRQYSTAAVVAERAKNDPAITCLAHDTYEVRSYARWMYQLALPSLRHQRISLDDQSQTPCSALIIATTKGDHMVKHQAELIGKEPGASWGLWRLPAPH